MSNNHAGNGGDGGFANGGDGGSAGAPGGNGGNGGSAAGGNGGPGGYGGAIYSSGVLSVSDSTLNANSTGNGGNGGTAAGGDGAKGNDPNGKGGDGGSANALAASGGTGTAIYQWAGHVDAINDTVTNNSGGNGGDSTSMGGEGGDGGCGAAGGSGGNAGAGSETLARRRSGSITEQRRLRRVRPSRAILMASAAAAQPLAVPVAPMAVFAPRGLDRKSWKGAWEGSDILRTRPAPFCARRGRARSGRSAAW